MVQTCRSWWFVWQQLELREAVDSGEAVHVRLSLQPARYAPATFLSRGRAWLCVDVRGCAWMCVFAPSKPAPVPPSPSSPTRRVSRG